MLDFIKCPFCSIEMNNHRGFFILNFGNMLNYMN